LQEIWAEDEREASVEVLPDVDDAAGDDGGAHPDDGGLLDEVEAGAENRTPASVLMNPSADLPAKSKQNITLGRINNLIFVILNK